MPAPKAHLLLIGSELTEGRLLDKNGQFLAKKLSDLGFYIERITLLPDNPDLLRKSFQESLQTPAAVLLSSGGLGHTSDDLTADLWAEVLGDPLSFSEELYNNLRTRLEERGIKALPYLERYARAPQKGEAIPNPVGLSPALYWEVGERVVCALPGPPPELQALWEKLEPRLIAKFRPTPPFQHTLRTTGLTESRVSALLEEWEATLPPGVQLAYNPSWEGVSLHLRAPAEIGEASFQAAVKSLRDRLKPYLYAEGDTPLAGALLEALKKRGETLAIAESCTGGHIAAALVDIPGASEVFLGGVVAYANSAKEALLGVSPAILREKGAVSEETARAMAEGVRRGFGSTWGIATTGIAGPTGGSVEKPVGTVWIGVTGPSGPWAKKYTFPGGRAAVIGRATATALSLLWQAVRGVLSPS